MRRLSVILLIIAGFTATGMAQPVTDVAGINPFINIEKQVYYADAGTGQMPGVQQVTGLTYRTVPENLLTRHNFLHHYCFSFKITNTTTRPDSVLFFPGVVLDAVIYSIDAATGRAQPVTSFYRHQAQLTGQKLLLPSLVVQPGQTLQYIIQPRFRYFNYTNWRPTLVKHSNVLIMMYEYRLKPGINFLFTTLFFLGILATMLVYAFLRFYTTRLKEFLFYGLSTLCFILYFFYQFSLLFNFSEAYNGLDLFLKQFLQIGAYIFYMLFAGAFLNIRKNLPLMHRVMQVLYVILGIYLLIVVCTAFNDRYYSLNMMLFNGVRILLLLYALYAIPVLLLCRVPLATYVGTGALAVSVLSGVAFYFSNVPLGLTSPFFYAIGGPIAFFKLGILIEQVCFILGLTRKLQVENINRVKAVELLRIDNEKKEFEKYMAVLETREKERTRIAQEIHDDIGSGLTTIRLLSEITKARGGQASMGEIDKISSLANELIENMNEIIWSFNSRNDTLPNLVAYIRRYVVSYFEPTSIQVKITIAPDIPPLQIAGDFRRSVFLVVKESLHNIMKHSQAGLVELVVEVQPQLSIMLRDDGKGFSGEEVKLFSNGLRSMRERMESIGGSFSISGNAGTTVNLSVPL